MRFFWLKFFKTSLNKAADDIDPTRVSVDIAVAADHFFASGRELRRVGIDRIAMQLPATDWIYEAVLFPVDVHH